MAGCDQYLEVTTSQQEQFAWERCYASITDVCFSHHAAICVTVPSLAFFSSWSQFISFFLWISFCAISFIYWEVSPALESPQPERQNKGWGTRKQQTVYAAVPRMLEIKANPSFNYGSCSKYCSVKTWQQKYWYIFKFFILTPLKTFHGFSIWIF